MKAQDEVRMRKQIELIAQWRAPGLSADGQNLKHCAQ
jgi:hypothetical protein